MILLALDTCDSRGSLAVLRDDEVLQAIPHEGTEDYSSWVLPSVEKALKASGLSIRDMDVFAVASGPGSFTGVRMGLTTVKAWSEAFGTKIASVSRLEAIAAQAASWRPVRGGIRGRAQRSGFRWIVSERRAGADSCGR